MARYQRSFLGASKALCIQRSALQSPHGKQPELPSPTREVVAPTQYWQETSRTRKNEDANLGRLSAQTFAVHPDKKAQGAEGAP